MIQLVVDSMSSLSQPLMAVLREAKERLGYTKPISVVEADDVAHDAVTVGLGLPGYDYKALSPKQLLTKGTSLSFLMQVLSNAIEHERGGDQPFEFTEGENYFVFTGQGKDRARAAGLVKEGGGPVALDIETAGNADKDPWCTGRILSIALYDGERALVFPEELCETEWMADYLVKLTQRRTVVCHNGTFDMAYLSRRLGTRLYHDEDTLLMHFVMNNTAQEHGLKPLAQRLFGAADWDSANKKYLKGGAHFENIPREQLYLYNAYDVYWTFQLYQLFKGQLEEVPNLRRYYRYRMEVSRMLQDVQTNGVLVDTSLLSDIGDECQRTADETLGVLQGMAGPTFNPNSPVQLKQALSTLFGISVGSTDVAHLEELRDAAPETERFITALLAHRRAKKILGTYVQGMTRLVGDDGRVHPTYLPHGAKSGRLSARSPNIQNQGRDSGVKRALVAPEGMVIVSCDYSQAELRTVAELSEDEHMIAAFADGAPDFFDNLMTKIYPDKFPTLADYEAFDERDHTTAKNMRALIKGCVYGSNYGRGVPAIAKALKVPLEQAQAVMDAYYGAYPKLKEWQDRVRRNVGKDDMQWVLTTPFGLKFRQEVITHRNRNAVENEALSFVPQSTANDICLHAAIEINKRIGYYGGKLIGLVHDATYCEVPEENAAAAGAMMEREMEGAARIVFHRVRFAAEAETGHSWQEV